jgi:hypothetical protein
MPRAQSDPLVAVLDGLQSSLDEGPCLDALRDYHTVHIDDMTNEPRCRGSRPQHHHQLVE